MVQSVSTHDQVVTAASHNVLHAQIQGRRGPPEQIQKSAIFVTHTTIHHGNILNTETAYSTYNTRKFDAP